MEPVLVDTSVWIDWFKGTRTPQSDRIARYLIADHPLWIAPVIIQETLQGVRQDTQFKQIQHSLLALHRFDFDPFAVAVEAAALYRDLRRKGVTIRKANDCLIAQYALLADMTLLHNDSDFDLIASQTTLKASRF